MSELNIKEILKCEFLQIGGFHPLIGGFTLKNEDEIKLLQSNPVEFFAKKFDVPQPYIEWAIANDIQGMIDSESLRAWEKGKNQKQKPTPSISGTNGYVYVIRDTRDGTYKIGKTRNPKNRFKSLGVLPAYKREHVALIQCKSHASAESALHKHFSLSRLQGEWFDLKDSDVSLIKQDSFLKELGIEVIA